MSNHEKNLGRVDLGLLLVVSSSKENYLITLW